MQCAQLASPTALNSILLPNRTQYIQRTRLWDPNQKQQQKHTQKYNKNNINNKQNPPKHTKTNKTNYQTKTTATNKHDKHTTEQSINTLLMYGVFYNFHANNDSFCDFW